MQKKIFKFGEEIIRKGETPKSLFIIAKGTCHLIHQSTARRQIQPDFNIRSLKQPLKGLCISKSEVTNREHLNLNQIEEMVKKGKMKESDLNDLLLGQLKAKGIQRKIFKHSNRNFRYEDLESENPNKYIAYKEHFILKTLNTGEILCSRALLSKNIGFDGTAVPGKDPEIEKALFNIVAVSSEVITYELKMNFIVYIPEDLKKTFLAGIKEIVDHDVMKVGELEKEVQAWDETKEMVFLREISKHREISDGNVYKRY